MSWFRSWLGFRRLSSAQTLANDWNRDSARVLKLILGHKKSLIQQLTELIALEARLSTLMRQVDRDFTEAEKLEKSHAIALDALQNENKILSEITVPTLTAQHKLLLARYDAETAIQARRQVSASVGEPE